MFARSKLPDGIRGLGAGAHTPKNHTRPATHRPLAERLECRRLLAAAAVTTVTEPSGYALSSISFGMNATGANPMSLVADASGNLYGTAAGGANGDGMVFEIPRGTGLIETLASFDDSIVFNSAVTVDADGNVYGTSHNGGTSGDGTVFEIAHGSSAIQTLASFNAGSGPSGDVTLDANGNLYGAAGGGPNGDGMVFEIARGTGVIQSLATFDNTSGFPEGTVALDASGNLYGSTFIDGPPAVTEQGFPVQPVPVGGEVFEIARGTTTIHAIASFNDNTGPPSEVSLDAGGNLYGIADSTVFEIAHRSELVQTLGAFEPDSGVPYGRVTVDASGNLYGTTVVYDNGNADASTVFEIVHGTSNVRTLASFQHPYAVIGPVLLDSGGNLYGATSDGGPLGAVFKLTPPLPGDADRDRKVGISDLAILARNYGMTNAAWTDGDFNGDGNVGFDDLVVLARNYGRSEPLGSFAPEPPITTASVLPQSSGPLVRKRRRTRPAAARSGQSGNQKPDAMLLARSPFNSLLSPS